MGGGAGALPAGAGASGGRWLRALRAGCCVCEGSSPRLHWLGQPLGAVPTADAGMHLCAARLTCRPDRCCAPRLSLPAAALLQDPARDCSQGGGGVRGAPGGGRLQAHRARQAGGAAGAGHRGCGVAGCAPLLGRACACWLTDALGALAAACHLPLAHPPPHLFSPFFPSPSRPKFASTCATRCGATTSGEAATEAPAAAAGGRLRVATSCSSPVQAGALQQPQLPQQPQLSLSPFPPRSPPHPSPAIPFACLRSVMLGAPAAPQPPGRRPRAFFPPCQTP